MEVCASQIKGSKVGLIHPFTNSNGRRQELHFPRLDALYFLAEFRFEILSAYSLDGILRGRTMVLVLPVLRVRK